LWRLPGAAGVAIALVTIPLIAITGEAGVFVALAALCLYPILDVPRTLARPSWWRAAIVSAIVWVVVFVTVVGIADSVGHLGEGTWPSCCRSCCTPWRWGSRAWSVSRVA
jgi:hypothetical protein